MSELVPGVAAVASQPPVVPSARTLRRDLRFLRWYSHTVKHVMRRYRADASTRTASTEPGDVLGRLERELVAESRRVRHLANAIMCVLLMPFLLAGLLWSGLYWLPVRIPWFPYERGAYGLPWFSLFEWFAFLSLAAFLAYSTALLIDGFASTRRVSADFHHLAEAGAEERLAIAEAARGGHFPRAAFVLAHAAPFEAYALLPTPSAEQPGIPA